MKKHITTNNPNIKRIKFSHRNREKHWVGDGFHVYGLLRPDVDLYQYTSPFILLDYAEPKRFPATKKKRGVGEHPHRGFETVTFALQGEITHRDSSGSGGIIIKGDIQWMTAGSGLVHEEYHSDNFSENGGVFEMVQLWVNLPQKNKMSPPKYQAIKDNDIPVINLGEGSKLRVIAGNYNNITGPAKTFTPINIYDVSSVGKDNLSFNLKDGTNTIIFILRGNLKVEDRLYEQQSVLIFERQGENINFESSKNFKAFILSGEPIDEPVYFHGPFVMNTKQEIIEAIDDYQKGKMGSLKLI